MKTIKSLPIALLSFTLFQGPAGAIGIYGAGDSSVPGHPDYERDMAEQKRWRANIKNNPNRQQELKNLGSNVSDIRKKQSLS